MKVVQVQVQGSARGCRRAMEGGWWQLPFAADIVTHPPPACVRACKCVHVCVMQIRSHFNEQTFCSGAIYLLFSKLHFR